MSASEFHNQPKAELHIHLRGAIPPSFLGKMLRKYPPAEALAEAPERDLRLFNNQANIRTVIAGEYVEDALFRYNTFDEFLYTYLFTSYFVRTIDDFRGLIATVREQLHQENIVYAEVTVSLIEYVNQGIPLEALLEALSEESATPPKVRWIVDLVRNIGHQAAEDLLDRIIQQRPENLVAITLGGAEHLFPPAQFEKVFAKARQSGLKLTVHAGEALGAESVWDALRILKVDRIGHGVRSIEDPSLVAYLAAHQIPLEICPTSNISTGVYSAYADHPVRKLFEAGVPITISTDDPTFFRVTLSQELSALSSLGFSTDEIQRLIDNSFRYAFSDTTAL